MTRKYVEIARDERERKWGNSTIVIEPRTQAIYTFDLYQRLNKLKYVSVKCEEERSGEVKGKQKGSERKGIIGCGTRKAQRMGNQNRKTRPSPIVGRRNA